MERFFKLNERGTSTVNTFSEVNAGVAAGGRTDLIAVFLLTPVVLRLIKEHFRKSPEL